MIMINRVAWRQGAVRFMPLGIQSHLTYFLLAHVGGQRPIPAGAWQAPRAVRPRSPVLTPQDRPPPPLETDGPRCQVVSPRCFSYAARPALIV